MRKGLLFLRDWFWLGEGVPSQAQTLLAPVTYRPVPWTARQNAVAWEDEYMNPWQHLFT